MNYVVDIIAVSEKSYIKSKQIMFISVYIVFMLHLYKVLFMTEQNIYLT